MSTFAKRYAKRWSEAGCIGMHRWELVFTEWDKITKRNVGNYMCAKCGKEKRRIIHGSNETAADQING